MLALNVEETKRRKRIKFRYRVCWAVLAAVGAFTVFYGNKLRELPQSQLWTMGGVLFIVAALSVVSMALLKGRNPEVFAEDDHEGEDEL